MKQKDKVCTAEQGKELKELGVTAKPYWQWIRDESALWGLSNVTVSTMCTRPAFDDSELGVMLGNHNCQSTGNVLEAKLRADKLIYCIKHELIKPEDLKL